MSPVQQFSNFLVVQTTNFVKKELTTKYTSKKHKKNLKNIFFY